VAPERLSERVARRAEALDRPGPTFLLGKMEPQRDFAAEIPVAVLSSIPMNNNDFYQHECGIAPLGTN
jgi:hypothetical protein